LSNGRLRNTYLKGEKRFVHEKTFVDTPSWHLFKGTVSRDFFCFWFFFHESVSPQPQSIPLGPFRIFSKIRGDICKSRCTTDINDTGGKFFQKSKISCICPFNKVLERQLLASKSVVYFEKVLSSKTI
jgi:hypothetical protein